MKIQALAAIGFLLMTQTAFAQEMRDFVLPNDGNGVDRRPAAWA